MKILYVCTGNICRSPLAEAITRHEIIKQGLQGSMATGSAGTYGYHVGERPDHRSLAVADRHGVSTAGQTARKVILKDFDDYDLILAMDRSHLVHLTEMAPAGAQSKLNLFMAYACGEISDIPDPYYGTLPDFEEVYAMIERGVYEMFSKIKR